MPQRAPKSTSKAAARSALEGGCLCGAIRFAIEGPVLDCASCHCRSCRKASSAPELPYAQVALADFRLIRGCEGPVCTLLFLDRTKAHGRRWCSMAVCGNRAKAAAHRARRASG